MHERRDNVLGTDVLGNFRLALECANLNFPTLETFEMALMRSFKLLLTHAACWTSILSSPFPLATCGDAPAHDETLLQSLDRVQFATDCRPCEHAARFLEGGCCYPAPRLQGGPGEPEEHWVNEGRSPAFCEYTCVDGLDRKTVYNRSRAF